MACMGLEWGMELGWQIVVGGDGSITFRKVIP